MSSWAATQLLRGQDSSNRPNPSSSTMYRWDLNRKRPSASYNDFSRAKRQHQAQASAKTDSLFISDDEDDLFGAGPDRDISFLGEADPEIADEPTHQQPQNPSQRPTAVYNSTSQNRSREMEVDSNASIGSATSPQNSTASTSTRPPTYPDREPTLVRIKNECDEVEEPAWVREGNEKDLVKIFVGKKNSLAWTKRINLKKSPRLESYIVTDPTGDEGSYIMRPQLAKIEPGLFDALLQFIDADEYAPLLLEISGRDGATAKTWDGLKSAEQYARELVRSGSLYLLAKDFEVEGMADKVYQKITEVDSQKFTLHSVIELAGVIFDDKRRQSETSEDRLEEWTVDRIASNFQEIMAFHQSVFWKVERRTKQARFLAMVLETVAHRYRTSGGKLQEAVVEVD